MAIEYRIDLAQEGRTFPHYWETCVGSCHAATVLREDVRQQIRAAHRDCGFRYLRFHGLLDDDMSVVLTDPFTQQIYYSFYNIDSIFDFLLDTGMKPFVELGFMPQALASGTQTCFNYRGNVTPPKDYDQWSDLIRALTGHLLERYGQEEVRQWFFEVWNEPNLRFFFDGTQEEYFRLYEVTARAIKSVDSRLRVGGPATSVNAWIPEFRAYCENGDVPLDFITTHHYPNDDPLSSAGMNGPGTKGQGLMAMSKEEAASMSQEEMQALIAQFLAKSEPNPRDILAQMTRKAKEEAGDYPLYYTEWNGSIEYDTSYQAAIIAQTIAYNEGLVEGYSFWTVSDIFEEMGLKPGVFKNEVGIQTMDGIPKPSYQVFKVLHEAGERRLSVEGTPHRTAEVLALTDGAQITILAYNHDISRLDVKPEEMAITLKGEISSIHKAVIDEGHTNPQGVWQEMGSPVYLSRRQAAQLRDAAQLVYEPVDVETGPAQTLRFTAQPESVTIFRVQRK